MKVCISVCMDVCGFVVRMYELRINGQRYRGYCRWNIYERMYECMWVCLCAYMSCKWMVKDTVVIVGVIFVTYAWFRVCVCVCVCVWVSLWMCTWVYMGLFVHVYMSVCMFVCVHVSDVACKKKLLAPLPGIHTQARYIHTYIHVQARIV
jgi:hypothetical protein